MKKHLIYYISILSGINIPIYASNQSDLDPMVITAARFARPANELAQPWTLIDSVELNKIRTETIGETLGWQPGIASSHFSAGVSRPIIRGQDSEKQKPNFRARELTKLSYLHYRKLRPKG